MLLNCKTYNAIEDRFPADKINSSDFVRQISQTLFMTTQDKRYYNIICITGNNCT